MEAHTADTACRAQAGSLQPHTCLGHGVRLGLHSRIRVSLTKRMLVATKLQLSAETARGGRTFLGKRLPQERERCSLRSEGRRRSPPAAPDAGRYGRRETGGRYSEMQRTTVGAKTQHAALAIAARCDRRCRALRWPMHRTASHRPATQGAAGGTLCGTVERARGESVRARRGGAQGRTPGMLLPERAAVISEGKRGLQSMYVGCQL